MAILKLARFAIRAELRTQAELAMHAHATYVRAELPAATWTVYRDGPAHYVAMLRAEDARADARYRDAPGTQAFAAALAPLLDGEISVTDCALVTSSDLQRRHRRT